MVHHGCSRLLGAVLGLLHAALVGGAGAKSRSLPDKDYSIYGKVVHKDMPKNGPEPYDDITRKCFQGFGFVSCENVGAPPELANSGFHWRTAVRPGAEFCLECCNNARLERTFSEMWNLRCDIEKGGTDTRNKILTDPYNHEFRFAQRHTLKPDDRTMVSCPIIRPREVWTVRVSDPTAAPITGYFQLRIGGTLTGQIDANAVSNKWEEMPLQTAESAPGHGLGESVQAKVFAAAGAVDVSRSLTHDYDDRHGEWHGFTWSITFREGEYPSEDPRFDRATNPFMTGLNRFDGNTTTIVVEPTLRDKMSGYTLTIEVRERFEGIKFWRSVESCYVNTTESTRTPTHFQESFRVQFSGAAGRAGGAGARVVRVGCSAGLALLLLTTWAAARD